MKRFNSFKAFFASDVEDRGLKYNVKNNNYLDRLVREGNRLKYAKGVVAKIRSAHDRFVAEAKFEPLPAEEWNRMKNRLARRASLVRAGERIYISAIFENRSNNEISVVVQTLIK